MSRNLPLVMLHGALEVLVAELRVAAHRLAERRPPSSRARCGAGRALAGSPSFSASSSWTTFSSRARALGRCEMSAMSSLFWLIAPARPIAVHSGAVALVLVEPVHLGAERLDVAGQGLAPVAAEQLEPVAHAAHEHLGGALGVVLGLVELLVELGHLPLVLDEAGGVLAVALGQDPGQRLVVGVDDVEALDRLQARRDGARRHVVVRLLPDGWLGAREHLGGGVDGELAHVTGRRTERARDRPGGGTERRTTSRGAASCPLHRRLGS